MSGWGSLPCRPRPLPFLIEGVPWGTLLPWDSCPFHHSGTSTEAKPFLWLPSAQLKPTGNFLSFSCYGRKMREINRKHKNTKMVWLTTCRILAQFSEHGGSIWFPAPSEDVCILASSAWPGFPPSWGPASQSLPASLLLAPAPGARN